jgi:aminoglycoside 3-N-acetyltransferase
MNRQDTAKFPKGKFLRKNIRALSYIIDRRKLMISEFQELLQNTGFTPGRVVMLHSSMDEIARRVPSITPIKFINLARELIGEEGTLMMPTFPFRGKQFYYIQNHTSFNVQRTPSKTGLITEIFRRMPGVKRSYHPTHPVAAFGKNSDELLCSHHLGTAFGEDSPFFKMQKFKGIVVVLGPSPTSLTLLHVPEELNEKSFDYQYVKEIYPMTIVDGEKTMNYNLRPLRPDGGRNYKKVIRIFIREGVLRYRKHRGLSVAVCDAASFIKRGLSLIDEGRYYY